MGEEQRGECFEECCKEEERCEEEECYEVEKKCDLLGVTAVSSVITKGDGHIFISL